MPLHVIVCGLIALVILFAWGAIEFWFENRRLRACAPARLPIGAPTMEERMQALETWRRESYERAAKEQSEGPSHEHRISVHRAHLLAARAIIETLEDGNLTDATVLLNLAQARANEASNTEALRFLGSEA